MASTRQLAEAEAFERRRLVAAFVCGSRRGPDAPRRGRSLVAGTAVAVLLVAGSAVVARLSPGPPSDWDDAPGLVLAAEDGQPYLVTDQGTGAVLRPVVNAVSARLALGAGAGVRMVPGDLLEAADVGTPVGIPGAPASLPRTGQLVDRGWTACTEDGHGLRLAISGPPQTTAQPGAGWLVHAGNRYFLVAEGTDAQGRGAAFKFPLPLRPGDRDGLLRSLDLPESFAAREVPPRWLDLVPSGPPLTASAFSLRGVGTPAPYAGVGSGLEAADARIGDVVLTAGDSYLLTSRGPTRLGAFARQVYLWASRRPERPVGILRTAGVPPEYPAAWPDGALAASPGEPCLVLDPGRDGPATVRLASAPTEDASAAEVPAGEQQVFVAAGGGAHVRELRRRGGSRAAYLVDGLGVRYRLRGQAAEQLGYGGRLPPLVPSAWLALLAEGVDLSPEAAVRPLAVEDIDACRYLWHDRELIDNHRYKETGCPGFSWP